MRFHLAFLALALVASTASASAEVTVVPHAVNVDPTDAEAITALCAQAYRAASGQVASHPTDRSGSASAPPEVFELNLVGLFGPRTHSVMLNGLRRDAVGHVVYEANAELSSLDDAPLVCARLAQSLVEQVPMSASQSHATVTAAESRRRERRLASTSSFGVKTGITAPLALNAQLAGMGSIAFDARLERDRWFYELGLGALIPGYAGDQVLGYGGVSADLGVDYYLVDSDIAPYVGLGVQPRLVFSGAGFNLVPYLQVGLTFSRKSGVRFYVDGRVGQNVLPAVERFYPTEATANFGLGF